MAKQVLAVVKAYVVANKVALLAGFVLGLVVARVL